MKSNSPLTEYPQSESDALLDAVQSTLVRKKLMHFRNHLHRRFVRFYVKGIITASVREIDADDDLEDNVEDIQSQYQQLYPSFATKLGEVAMEGLQGNYVGFVLNSINSVMDFLKQESGLRDELHRKLIDEFETNEAENKKNILEDNASIELSFNELREDHFYFQNEIEQFYKSGQLSLEDYQKALEISNQWKEELMNALTNLSKYYFEKQIEKVKESETSTFCVYHDLIFKIMTLFLLTSNKTAKIHSLSECPNVFRQFFHALRNVKIAKTLNEDGGLMMSSVLQGDAIKLNRNSKRMRAFIALLKQLFVKEKKDLLQSNFYLRLISHHINLLYQKELTHQEQLELYGNYYFNKVERKAHNDQKLEKQIFGTSPHADLSDKGQAFFESLKFLGHALLDECSKREDTHKRLLTLQEKIQSILTYYFKHIREALLRSTKISEQDEKKINAFVIKQLNLMLKQKDMSNYFQSYFYGLVKFNTVLRQPNRIWVTEDAETGEIKAVFVGKIFNRLNQLNAAAKEAISTNAGFYAKRLAESGSRTRTMSPSPDFESGASTSSATSA